MNETTNDDTARNSAWTAWLRARFASPSAVYGLILYSALIMGVSDHHTDSWEVLLVSGVSLLIFFVAHVFAHTLSDHGEKGYRASVAGAVHHSSGMLYAALPSTAVLVVGGATGMPADDSVELALLLAVLTLGVLGYSAYAQRGSSRRVRVVGAIGTALLGALVMLLNYAVH
ncbi:MAG: hypothetical protein KKH75_03565 [Actinobacteria bacterium]|nr:hypothetical protein [Actinomycetota bacterium]